MRDNCAAHPNTTRPNSRENCEPPSLDAVLLWLTPTIERDFDTRHAFLDLRAKPAPVQPRANTTLHFLTPQQADAVLTDAEARGEHISVGLKNAYAALARNMRLEIEEAKNRQAEFEAVVPVCLRTSEYQEEWRGTKQQLQAMGIGRGIAFPGEAGGKMRVHSTDERGFVARINKASQIWAGLFIAHIDIPQEVRVGRPEAKWKDELEQLYAEQEEWRIAKRADIERMNREDAEQDALARIGPTDLTAFREAKAEQAKTLTDLLWAGVFHDKAGAFAFAMDDDDKEALRDAFEVIQEVVASAGVVRDKARAAELESAFRVDAAKADAPLQAFLKRIQ